MVFLILQIFYMKQFFPPLITPTQIGLAMIQLTKDVQKRYSRQKIKLVYPITKHLAINTVKYI